MPLMMLSGAITGRNRSAIVRLQILCNMRGFYTANLLPCSTDGWPSCRC